MTHRPLVARGVLGVALARPVTALAQNGGRLEWPELQEGACRREQQ